MNPEAQRAQALFKVECCCKYFWSGGMMCSHIFAVFNSLQVKSISKLKAFERWTKRIQWENYATNNPSIMPLDPALERRLEAYEKKPGDFLHNHN